LFNLTILIPIHNETEDKISSILAKYLDYSSSIIIVDSGNRKQELHIPWSNVTYIYIPNLSFVDKLIYVSESIMTDSLLLNPVDDYIPDSIFHDLTNYFISSEYLYLSGRSKSFVNNDSISTENLRFNKNKIKMRSSLSLYVNYDFPLIWGYYKTRAFREAFKVLAKCHYSNENFYELSLVTILPSIGPIASSDETIFVREFRKGSWSHKNKTQTILDLLAFKNDQKKLLILISRRSKSLLVAIAYVIHLLIWFWKVYVVNYVYNVLVFLKIKTIIKKTISKFNERHGL
jgi:hypothetical protein